MASTYLDPRFAGGEEGKVEHSCDCAFPRPYELGSDGGMEFGVMVGSHLVLVQQCGNLLAAGYTRWYFEGEASISVDDGYVSARVLVTLPTPYASRVETCHLAFRLGTQFDDEDDVSCIEEAEQLAATAAERGVHALPLAA